MFRKMAIAFAATYAVAWLSLYALAMDGSLRAVAANFVDYMLLSWTPGAGELVAFIQFGALASASVVALVGVPGWRVLRDLWRRSRA